MKTLVERIQEIKILKSAIASKKSEFVSVVGRRRIGKTFLIKQICHDHLDFELTGLQDANQAEQLQNFVFA
jgi:hypothetical protein